VKALVARFLGANRRKVIVVFGGTRAEVECAARHARTGAKDLPIWAYCAAQPGENAEPVAECERFASGAAAGFRNIWKDLRHVWPALSIVAWTGKNFAPALKLTPFTIPPFRVLVLNEAEDFFAASPASISRHLRRRLRDACVDWSRFLADYNRSFVWHTRERIADGLNWGWESLLALLAFGAEWTPPLARFAVKRLRGERAWSMGFEAARNASFIEVPVPNRGWPGRAVLRAVRGSNAEFLVLRGRGEHGSASPLIAIARETNAFAVGKQAAHSAWRKRVVTKHPFRPLQAGEVSEVFAPHSSLLVLRRGMLLRLGVPRALTYGAALMILFWKSSSAGLRSLVVGHGDAAPDESAMALEDAELALRLTLSRSLTSLGARRPARFRGNVAWSPGHRRGFRDKPRVLVVSPYLPFPLSHGGAVRIYNLCRAMAGEIDFVLACFREAKETVHYEELHECFREVYVVDADEIHRDPALPKQASEYRNEAMADLIRSLCFENRVDLVQLEYTQLAEYRNDTGAVPVILVEHDITFTLYRQLADINPGNETRREYERWLEFEREALQCSDMVWTMSEEDRSAAIEYGAPHAATPVIPNGVDLGQFVPAPKGGGPPTILFVGAFRHVPNLLAFEALRKSIMPKVWQECPDAVLHVIAGLDHERAAERVGKKDLLTPDPRIAIEGFVADVRPAYREADVVAVPLPVSAGTNIKLMEAMACGRAVVSTPAGCRGLRLENGRELIVADLSAEFARGVVKLLRDQDLRMSIAAEARRTAERRFGWDTIAQRALRSYGVVMPKVDELAVG
jgi:glycosyltransferase involved in cell wall biosynthesis